MLVPRCNGIAWSQAHLATTPFFGRELERAENVLDATDAVIGAHGVDRSRGGSIDTTVLIRPQSFCFKKARRDDPIVRRAGCRERQTE
jgi:hypothetical protein